MNTVDTVVVGTVVTENGVLPEACVAISGGRVAGLLTADSAPAAAERLEFPGCLVLPGLIDAHIHCQHDPKGLAGDGFAKTTTAAAAGGISTVIEMPQDIGGAVLTADYLEAKRRAGEAESLLDFALWAAADPTNIGEIESLTRAGVVGFKMFMSECRYMQRMDDGNLLDALHEIARVGSIGALHAESLEITAHLTRKFREQGLCEPEMHPASRPEIAEVEAVMRAVEYARWTGADVHFCHISLARVLDYVYRQRLDYPLLTAETCPQYLVLSEEAMQRGGAYAKIDPPLRKAGENEAVWEQVRLSRVDLIASDHGPHKHKVKSAPCIFDNNSGSPGVETLVPLVFSEGVIKRGLPLEKFATLLSAGPARRFGLYPRKGALSPGSDADLVVIDPRAQWEIRAADLHQTSGWTNYEGIAIQGRPILTMVRGLTVFREGDVVGPPGHGRFVPSARAARIKEAAGTRG